MQRKTPGGHVRRIILSLTFTLIVCGGLALRAEAVPTNGDFAAGLTAWSTLGDVTVDNEEAVVGDDGVTYSALWQAVALAPGNYTFAADILNGLSSVPDPVGSLDTFFATLFFTDSDPGNFDPVNNRIGTSLVVFALSANGFDNPLLTGPSSKGGNWRHVTFGFLNTNNFVIPTFELFAQNNMNADSTVRVDNVVISGAAMVVPEPGTLMLFGIGIVLVRPYQKSRWGKAEGLRL